MYETQHTFPHNGSEIKLRTKTASLKTSYEVRLLLAEYKKNPYALEAEARQMQLLDTLDVALLSSGEAQSASSLALEAVRQGKIKFSELAAMQSVQEMPAEIQNDNDTITMKIFCAVLDTSKNTPEEQALLQDETWLAEQEFSTIEAVVNDFLQRAQMKKPV